MRLHDAACDTLTTERRPRPLSLTGNTDTYFHVTYRRTVSVRVRTPILSDLSLDVSSRTTMLLTFLQTVIFFYAVYGSGKMQQPPTASTNTGLSRVVTEGAFTQLTHTSLAGYDMRVKKTAFCDPSVKYG